jgi:hypothetical protein
MPPFQRLGPLAHGDVTMHGTIEASHHLMRQEVMSSEILHGDSAFVISRDWNAVLPEQKRALLLTLYLPRGMIQYSNDV